MIRRSFAFLPLAAIAACAEPNEPTISAADVNRAFAEAQILSRAPLTEVGDLPSGSATYNGQIGADLEGDLEGSILGDMRMTVDFAGNEISGKFSNINLVDPDGAPNQRFGGSLSIDGFEADGEVNGLASGDLSGVDENGSEYEAQTVLVLDGAVRDDLGTADGIYGTATGTGSGDVSFSVDGVLFGTTR